MNSFWRVSLSTRNFDFEAFGATEKEAGDALTHGLRKHAEQYHLPRDWWYDFKLDIASNHISLPSAYRGPELIVGR